MFEIGQTVLVTGDWENNNTNGKLGIILNIDSSRYKIGFFEELNKTNGDTEVYQKRYGSIKSTWWVREYVLKKAITKNKFK